MKGNPRRANHRLYKPGRAPLIARDVATRSNRAVGGEGKTGELPATCNARAGAEADPGEAIAGLLKGGASDFRACAAPQPGDGRAVATQALGGRFGVVQPANVTARLITQCGKLAPH